MSSEDQRYALAIDALADIRAMTDPWRYGSLTRRVWERANFALNALGERLQPAPVRGRPVTRPHPEADQRRYLRKKKTL